MTIDEIFSKLSSHMIQGMMTHEQLMNCYEFLGLSGYSACHEYHYLSETKGYIRLTQYKIKHYGTLIQNERVTDPEIIPATWIKGIREAVDPATRKEALSAAIDTWIDWEEQTKALYNECYAELMRLGDMAAADFILSYINDVEEEIVFAKEERIKKNAINFDIVSIVEEQDSWIKTFRKKIRKLK